MMYRTCFVLIQHFIWVQLLFPACSNAHIVRKEQEIEVIGNPHALNGCSRDLNDLLEPYHILMEPKKTQADTFLELSQGKVLSVPVPIYRMKQPARLNPSQFEFQLILVKDLSAYGASNVKEVDTPAEIAVDSWFPGYQWAPLVMSCGDENMQHVGWKFTALDEESVSHAHFYALMVQVNEKNEALRVAGFKAPGWMIGAVRAGTA